MVASNLALKETTGAYHYLSTVTTLDKGTNQGQGVSASVGLQNNTEETLLFAGITETDEVGTTNDEKEYIQECEQPKKNSLFKKIALGALSFVGGSCAGAFIGGVIGGIMCIGSMAVAPVFVLGGILALASGSAAAYDTVNAFNKEDEAIDEKYSEMDTNNDKEYTVEEWKEHAKSYGIDLTEFDTNSDGKLSLEEQQEYFDFIDYTKEQEEKLEKQNAHELAVSEYDTAYANYTAVMNDPDSTPEDKYEAQKALYEAEAKLAQ